MKTPEKTRDYDKFKLFESNAPVKRKHVQDIMTNITTLGNFLEKKPIFVTEDFYVLDGQHRLAAARELGIDIYYIVYKDLDESHIAALNVAVRNWAPDNYIHFHAVTKNGKFGIRYNNLQFLMDKYNIKATAAINIAYNTTSHTSHMAAIKEGKPQNFSLDAAEKRAKLIGTLQGYFSHYHQTRFIRAMIRCIKNELINKDHLFFQLKKNSHRLLSHMKDREYLRDFEDVYHKGKYKNASVDFFK
tara:strand:+ start:192 stop:926 length:735 start_codon:yes stop_codon:yes gene_type:complete